MPAGCDRASLHRVRAGLVHGVGPDAGAHPRPAVDGAPEVPRLPRGLSGIGVLDCRAGPLPGSAEEGPAARPFGLDNNVLGTGGLRPPVVCAA